MRYGKDLRGRVVSFVARGGSKSEAARRFGVTRATVHNWLRLGADLAAQKPGPKGASKLDWNKLAKAVEKRPDAMLKELAEQFGVGTTAVWYALDQMKLVRKKKPLAISKPVRSSGVNTSKRGTN
jgi:transposase